MDRLRLRERRKSSAVRLLEREIHALSKIKRAVDMKIAVENSKSYNIAPMRKGLKTESEERK